MKIEKAASENVRPRCNVNGNEGHTIEDMLRVNQESAVYTAGWLIPRPGVGHET